MLRHYKGSILFTLVCLALAVWYGWMQTGSAAGTLSLLWIVVVLSVLEVSLSFDNAVVNAAVLEDMDEVWQRRFLTWGMLIAVFGMRIVFPLAIVGAPHKEALRRARAALDKVGLLEREKAHPIALSGGEQQRLAIARAVVNRPAILLADEPTANLDVDSASDILAIFRAFHQVGVTLVVATHDPQWMARFSPRVLRLERGQLVSDSGDSA